MVKIISLIFMLLAYSLSALTPAANAAVNIPQGKIAQKESKTYNLSEVFGNTADINSFYLTFKNSPAANFSISYNSNINVSVVDGFITIAQVDSILQPDKIKVLYYSQVDNRSSFVNIGYQIADDKAVTLQVVQSDSEYHYVASSPVVDVVDVKKDELNSADKSLVINNLSSDSTLSILRSSFVDIPDNSDRVERSSKLECIIPILAITNYILNTPCDLTLRAYTYLAGDKDNSSGKKGPNAVNAFTPEFELSAVSYSPDINPYAALSAATVCEAPLSRIYSKRKPRSPEQNDCLYNSLEILTPYLILTHHDFDRAHFDRTITNILNRGSSGIANASPALEQQLVTAVQDRAHQANVNIQQVTHRLFAQASALNTSTVSLNEILSSQSANNQPSTSQPQPLALGHYELHLNDLTTSSFTSRYPNVRPRAWNGSAFTTTSADFTVELIQTATQAQRNQINGILNDWYPDEASSDSASDSDSDTSGPAIVGGQRLEAKRLLAQGRNLADSVREDLSANESHQVYIVVSYNGRPAALIQGFVNESESDEAVLIASISSPENIAVPYSSRAVRGAGQRGLQEFIKYCLSKGIKTINTNAVTAPSAHIKAKYGFKFEDEL